jgi:hypothetical protein
MSQSNFPNAVSLHLEESFPVDDLTRVFNSAIVSTRAQASRDFSEELFGLVQSPAFRAILNSVKTHSRNEGITERLAAEQIIETFRKMDRIWGEYIAQEGIERLQ